MNQIYIQYAEKHNREKKVVDQFLLPVDITTIKGFIMTLKYDKLVESASNALNGKLEFDEGW